MITCCKATLLRRIENVEPLRVNPVYRLRLNNFIRSAGLAREGDRTQSRESWQPCPAPERHQPLAISTTESLHAKKWVSIHATAWYLFTQDSSNLIYQEPSASWSLSSFCRLQHGARGVTTCDTAPQQLNYFCSQCYIIIIWTLYCTCTIACLPFSYLLCCSGINFMWCVCNWSICPAVEM